VLVLKGAARLLAGEPAGTRSMADIDLLVDATAGQLLHEALSRQLGYRAETPGTPDRHLPALVRADGLPIEIHHRVRDHESALEHRLWTGARRVPLGVGSVDIPDSTALLMHALDHAAVVHRALHFRLRDVLDTAVLMGGDCDPTTLNTFVCAHPQRRVVETLLDTAASVRRVAPKPDPAAQRQAWRRIHRVGTIRLLAPARHGVAPTADPRVLVLSQLADGSLDTALRLAGRAARWPRKALRLMSGAWLPAEAGGVSR
jgi:transposase-like protein